MEYEDRLRISTPEGLELELVIAGLGSRFIAGGIDLVIKGLLVGALALLLLGGEALTGAEVGESLGTALLVTAVFLVTFFYDVLFEIMASGRTPGKRLTGLRVVGGGGNSIGLRTSVVRNVLRLVDGPGTGYSVAVLSILLTPRHRRLGDLAAGTFVVRERTGEHPPSSSALPGLAVGDPAAVWDLSGVGAEELAAVRSFLERRSELPPEARSRLAGQFDRSLRPRVTGAAGDGGSEAFLERLVAARAARG